MPLYIAIFLLCLIPFKAAELPKFNPDAFTLSEFLKAKADPRTGKWMVYLSSKGSIFFGKVESIDKDHSVVWLRHGGVGLWCPYSIGVWVDYNQLLSIREKRSPVAEKLPERSVNLIQLT